EPSVGKEGDCANLAAVAVEGADILPGGHVQQADDGVTAPRGEGPAVRREGDHVQRTLGATVPATLQSGSQLPQADRLVEPAACSRQGLAVGGEYQRLIPEAVAELVWRGGRLRLERA